MITGINIFCPKTVHMDGRRDILEIINGQITIRNVKLITAKAGNVLGGHYHLYPEARYLMSGKMGYKVSNILTGEKMEFTLNAEEIFMSTGFVIHTATIIADSVILDMAGETYTSAEINDLKQVDKTETDWYSDARQIS